MSKLIIYWIKNGETPYSKKLNNTMIKQNFYLYTWTSNLGDLEGLA